MKKLLALLAFFFLFLSPLYGQSEGAAITGQIYDQQGQPISSASVAVFDSTQSHIVTGASSRSNGSFRINLDPGSYALRITFISFRTHTEAFTVEEGETKAFGEIILEPTTEQLGEVVVRAEQSQMEMNFDKRVFNVGQDITSLGGSALNVLNNVPSILTDIDGNISLRGNSSVRVLINGKPSNRVSNGNVSALRSIPSSMIERVEIITNPSAKYSAEGSGGIINIILKKEQDGGFNGSVNAGAGHPSNYELGTNLNYRVNNINWFGGGSFDYRSSPEEGSSFQRFASPDTSYMYREVSGVTESDMDVNLRFGADFFLSENETLTASTFFEIENSEQDQDVTYTDFNYAAGVIHTEPMTDSDIIQQVYRDNVEDASEKEFEFNLEYENRYNGDEHKLTAEMDFDLGREEEHTDINEQVIGGSANPASQRTRNSGESMDFRAEADYIRPLGESGKLEAGMRTSFDRMENSYLFEQLQNGTWVPEPSFNNNFIFNENINSAYLIVGSELGSFSGQIGLRLENTRIHTELKKTGNSSEQNYTNLFPSVFLNYAFNEQQSVQFSYSRRLNRPWSRMLLPFTDYTDSRSRWSGNPNLSPEFSHNFETGYLHYWGSGSLLTSFYYRHRTDVIERIIIFDDAGLSRRLPINLATEEAWGVEFSADQELINDLTLTANANFYTSQSEGRYQGQLLASDTETFQARFGIRWKINNLWNFQYSARYRAPRETTQGGRRAAMTMMNSGIARELFDGRATISLSVRDLLNSRNHESTITDDGNPLTDFYSHREFRWSSRSFSLNFTYHFGREENQR